jgi:N-acetylmuramoyl-L-alanine amidase
MATAPASAAAGRVAIDIGHTLEAPGATSARGIAEFTFNRQLGVALGQAVRDEGMAVEVINEDGMVPSLAARSRAADGAALLVSVHHDSVQPHYLSAWEHEGVVRPFSDRFSGFSLFVSRKNSRLSESLKCASAMGAALRAAGFTPSLYHAQPIAGESKPFADRANGVHYFDNLVVLKTARGPAVLFEAGVIVNREEELQLADVSRQQAMARALARGLAACVRR